MDDQADESERHELAELKRNAKIALDDLERRLKAFRLRSSEFAGDLSLYGFLRAAWECGKAACHIVEKTDFTAGAYPSVRASFEASEDALLLATEQHYSAAGARVRVFERLEHADLKEEMHVAFSDDGDPPPPPDYAEATSSIENDADSWDRDCPGRGELLRSALDHFLPRFRKAKTGAKHPGHWSELSRRRMASEIARRVAEPEFGRSLAATYAQLSRASHPRFRVESWEKYRAEDGQSRFRRHPREARIVLGVAELSARAASMAFDRLKADELPPSDV